MKGRVLLALALLAFAAPAPAADLVVDDGTDAAVWSAQASPGARARIVDGRDGSVGLAFDLGRARGYAVARRNLGLDLPADYLFTFSIRGDAEPNTLEIKFISGPNVWWRRLRDFEIPRGGRDLPVSKARIAFAWGPDGSRPPGHLDAIEIAVVAGKGGKGTLWVDAIRVVPRDPAAAARLPSVTVSSSASQAGHLLDGRPDTVWRSAEAAPEVVLDFHEAVEQGGLLVDQPPGGSAKAYRVDASLDGVHWREVRRVVASSRDSAPVFLPDVFARYLRLRFEPPPGQSVAVAEIRVQPYAFSESENGFFTALARAAAPGLYPRYFSGEQSYWTVVGTPGGNDEALINEEGSVEARAGGFTLEPFVWRGGRLRTWKDTANRVSLDGGDLPIPTVTRTDGDLDLSVTAFASSAESLLVRYRVTLARGRERLRLFAALRPFQVLPPWQTLNRTGGVARISRVAPDATVDGQRVLADPHPDAFGAAAFDQGDVTDFLVRGEVPPSRSVRDPFAHASAAMAWDLDVEAGRPRDVWIEVPWSGRRLRGDREAELERVRADWRARVGRVGIELPAAVRDWSDSLRSNLAYVLVNMDGPAIQPGSRTYERSWIRDGAMTSAALLELGLDDDVKRYLRWYAGYVARDGWVPCCVDRLGADPTPEHDSFGEFVWAVGEVWRFTHDLAFVREMWPRVRAAAGCMSRLRARRTTAPFREEDRRAYFGLLPESISHEGYSARPVHSYWDQAFALRGFRDAAMLADVVGDHDAGKGLAAERDAFAADLRASVLATMAAHRMDLVPASVELGDFDPTSTAVSFLLGTDDVYPRDALERSFAKYMHDLRARRGNTSPGVGYTAYELRSATALVLLGRKADAIEMLGELTADQRPAAWNQWPEITWRNPTEAAFLGDLPHTWIGSSYVHAVRTLLVAEREQAGNAALLVGQGIPVAWLDDGGEVRGRELPTWFGPLSVTIRRIGAGRVEVAVASAGRFDVPAGGIQVFAPFGGDVVGARVDGVVAALGNDGSDAVRISRLPAAVSFDYNARLENQP